MILMMIIKLNEEWRRDARWETLLIFPKRSSSGETYRQLFLPLSLPPCHPPNTQPPLSVVLLRLSFRNTSPELASSCYLRCISMEIKRKAKESFEINNFIVRANTNCVSILLKNFRFMLCVSREKTRNLWDFQFFFPLLTLEQSNVHENKKQGDKKHVKFISFLCHKLSHWWKHTEHKNC